MKNSPYLDQPLRPLGEIVNKVAALALLKTAIGSLESDDLYGAAQCIDAALTQVKILHGDAR